MSESIHEQAKAAAERNAGLKVDPETGLVFNAKAEGVLAKEVQAEMMKTGAGDAITQAEMKASAEILADSEAAAARNAKLKIDPKTGLVFNPENN